MRFYINESCVPEFVLSGDTAPAGVETYPNADLTISAAEEACRKTYWGELYSEDERLARLEAISQEIASCKHSQWLNSMADRFTSEEWAYDRKITHRLDELRKEAGRLGSPNYYPDGSHKWAAEELENEYQAKQERRIAYQRYSELSSTDVWAPDMTQEARSKILNERKVLKEKYFFW